MKIDINKNQYEVIIKSLATSGSIFGPMSDFVDEKFKKDSDSIEEVITYLLKYAKDFNFHKNISGHPSDEGKHLSEKYDCKIMDDMKEYDRYISFEEVVTDLTERDFFNKYSKDEVKKIHENCKGYLRISPEYCEIESLYNEEFEDRGYNRLFIGK